MQAPDLLGFFICTFSCHTQNPPYFLPNEHRASLPGAESRNVKLTTRLHLMPRLLVAVASFSVICSGTGYLTRLRLKTFMVQDSINHSPTLGHVVRGTSADHPVNSRVDHEFVGGMELISPPNTRVFPFEICTLCSISILHFGSAYTSNGITKQMRCKKIVWCE